MTTAIKRVREALSRVFRRSDDEGHVEWHPSEEDALLEEGRERGAADARRHAEEFFTIIPPIREEFAATCRRRIAEVREWCDQRLRELGDRLAEAEVLVEDGAKRLQGAESELARIGARDENAGGGTAAFDGLALAVMAALAVVCAAVLVATGLIALATAAALLLGAVASAAMLSVFALGSEWALRREARRSSALMTEQSVVARQTSEAIEALPDQARALAESEKTRAEEALAAYASSAFSALPPGSLANVSEAPELALPEIAIPTFLSEDRR